MTFLFMTVVVALRIMAQNRMRSLLTMLGIIIGVGSVVGMLALGNGFQQFLDSQFDQLGIAGCAGCTLPDPVFLGLKCVECLRRVESDAAGRREIDGVPGHQRRDLGRPRYGLTEDRQCKNNQTEEDKKYLSHSSKR